MKPATLALLSLGLHLGAPVPPGEDFAARAELLVRVNPQDRSQLLIGAVGGRQRELYRTPEGSLADALVSPRERYVAVLRTHPGIWMEDRGWARPPRNDLVLLSRSGRVLRGIGEDVRRFIFSPDATHLGYIVGNHFDGGIGFEPRGVKLLEISSGRIRQVALHPRFVPYDLHWVRTSREDAVLIKVLGDPEVGQIRFAPRGGAGPEADSSRDFHLSPDGRYYYRTPWETILSGECRLGEGGSSCFEVRKRADRGDSLPALSAAGLGRPHGWVAGNGHQLLFSSSTYRENAAEGPDSELVLEQVDNKILDVGRSNPVENPVDRFQGKISRGAALGDWTCCSAHVVYWPVGVSAEDALRNGIRLWPPPRPEPPPLKPRPLPGRLLGLSELLDFEFDAGGRPLAVGEIVSEQWAAMGVHVSAGGPGGVVAMVFDSSRPTGGDPDLGTPNEDFDGGRGVGDGGKAGTAGENREAQGKILVLAPPGRAHDPGDSLDGGTFEFAFERPVELIEVHLLDVDDDREAGEVVAFDGAGVEIARARMLPLGDNSFQRLPLAAAGVRLLKVRFPASGALAALRFRRRDTGELADLARAWAAAWSEQRTDDYLAYYSERFIPRWQIRLDEWRELRRERVSRPRFIRVTLENVDAWFTGPDTASVRFEQVYESDRYRDRVPKILDLVGDGAGWKIVGEWVGGEDEVSPVR